MNKKIVWGIVIVVIVAIVLILSLGSKDAEPVAVEKETIEIGAALMLTGPTALLGELQQKGINLALNKINAEGGINGRPLEIVVEDAMYNPKQAVSAYQALKQRGLRNFIIDGSPIVAATRQLIVDDGNFSIAPVATAPSYFDGDSQTCRISLTAKTIAPSTSEYLLKNGYKKIAILVSDNEYGHGWVDEFNKVYPVNGGTILATEFYGGEVAGNDYRTNITKIKAVQAQADAIVYLNAFATIESMLKQMKDLGITKPLISDFSTLTNPGLKDATLLEGVEFLNYEYDGKDLPTDSEKTKAFKQAYRAAYNSDPIYLAAGHYEVTILLADAIKAVGEDPQKIAEYVSNLKNYDGITGTFSFNSDCEVDRNVVFQKVVNGKFVIVK